jgi:hypothetical protein
MTEELTRTCSKCNQDKPISDFWKCKTARGGRRPDCNACGKKQRKDHEAKPEIKAARSAFYKKRHVEEKEKRNQYHQKWYEAKLKDKGKGDPEYYKKYRDMVNKAQRERGERDSMFKIKRNLCRVMHKFFKKDQSTFDIVGCTATFLNEWINFNLELQTQRTMTLDNYGKIWHIDHVIPCTSFDLSNINGQKHCFNWANLRPMIASENIIKGDNLDFDACQMQEQRAYTFLASKGFESKKDTDVALTMATSLQLQLPFLKLTRQMGNIRSNDAEDGKNVEDTGTIRSEDSSLPDLNNVQRLYTGGSSTVMA